MINLGPDGGDKVGEIVVVGVVVVLEEVGTGFLYGIGIE